MKLLKDVRYGTLSISKIYFNHEVIYEKTITKTILEEHPIINVLQMAVPEIFNDLDLNAQGYSNIISMAYSEPTTPSDIGMCTVLPFSSQAFSEATVPDISLCSGEIQVEAKTKPDIQSPLNVNLANTIKTTVDAMPDLNHTDIDGISQVIISSKAISGTENQKNAIGIPNICLINKGLAIPAPGEPVFSHSQIKNRVKALGLDVDLEEVCAFTQAIEIISNAVLTNNTVDAKNKSIIVTRPRAITGGAKFIDASAKCTITMKDRATSDNNDRVAYGKSNVKIQTVGDGKVANTMAYAKSDIIIDVITGGHTDSTALDMHSTIVTSNLVTVAEESIKRDVDSHANMTTKAIAFTEFWEYPKDFGDYLLITQAFEINNENEGILEVR